MACVPKPMRYASVGTSGWMAWCQRSSHAVPHQLLNHGPRFPAQQEAEQDACEHEIGRSHTDHERQRTGVAPDVIGVEMRYEVQNEVEAERSGRRRPGMTIQTTPGGTARQQMR